MKTAFLFLAVILLASFSNAQLASETKADASKPTLPSEAPPAPEPSAKYKALVKELMVVTHVVENQETMVEQIAEKMIKEAKDPVKAKKSVTEYFQKAFSVDAMLTEISQSYQKYFTESDLKKLIAFYKSPVGQKAVSKMPEVTKEMMMKAQLKMQLKKAEFNRDKEKLEGFK